MSQTLFINATLACIDTEAGYGLRDSAASHAIRKYLKSQS